MSGNDVKRKPKDGKGSHRKGKRQRRRWALRFVKVSQDFLSSDISPHNDRRETRETDFMNEREETVTVLLLLSVLHVFPCPDPDLTFAQISEPRLSFSLSLSLSLSPCRQVSQFGVCKHPSKASAFLFSSLHAFACHFSPKTCTEHSADKNIVIFALIN